MNPEFPQSPREELEAKLTALILGELPADEAFNLGRAIEKDAELAELYRRLQKTVELVRETATSPAEEIASEPAPVQLSSERREKLLAQFRTVSPKEFASRRQFDLSRLIPYAAAAAIVLLLAAISIPNFVKARTTSQANAIINNLRQLDGAKQQWALENKKSGKDRPTLKDLAPYLKDGKVPDVAGEQYTLNRVDEPVLANVEDSRIGSSKKLFSAWRRGEHVLLTSDGEQVRLREEDRDALREVNAITPRGRRPGAITEFRVDGGEAGATSAGSGDRNSRAVPSTSETAGKAMEFGTWSATPAQTPALSVPQATIALPPVEQKLAPPAAEQPQSVFFSNTLNPSDQAKAGEKPEVPVVVVGGNSEVSFAVPVEGQVVLAPSVEQAEKERILGEVQKLEKRASVSQDRGVGVGGGGAVATTAPSNVYSLNVVGYTTPPAAQAPLTAVPAMTPPALAGEPSDGKNPAAHRFPAIAAEQAARRPQVRLDDSFFAKQEQDGVFDGALTRQAPGKAVLGFEVANAATETEKLGEVTKSPAVPVDSSKPWSAAGTLRGFYDGNVDGFSSGAPQVPVLGDAPFLGKLFQASTNSDSYVRGGEYRSLSTLGTDEAVPMKFTHTNVSHETDFFAFSPDKSSVVGLTDLGVTAAGRYQTFDSAGDVPKADDATINRGVNGQLPTLTLADPRSGKSDGTELQYQYGLKWYEANGPPSVNGRAPAPDVLRRGGDAPSSGKLALAAGQERDLERSKELAEPGQSFARRYSLPKGAQIAKDESDSSSRKEVQQLEENRKLAEKDVALQNSAGGVPGSLVTGLPRQDKEELAKVVAAASEPASAGARIEVSAAPTTIEDLGVGAGSRATNISSGESLNLYAKKERLEDAKRGINTESTSGKAEQKSEAEPAAVQPPKPAPIPQPEVQTRDNAFSTFSLNVSDVSFKLAGATLEKGTMPDAASIRSEEFINAFDYRDPEPAPGAPIAFASEQARYPFAHNRDLLRFSIKTAAQGRQPGRPLNLVLVLDNSGSMERADRARIIQEALKVLAAQLQPQDRLSVITFSRTARLWIDGVPGDQAAKVADEVAQLTPQGGTNFEEAMRLAYETATRHYLASGINRVVLLTDGAANLGNVDPDALKAKVEAQRKQGIALDCFGIGWEGYNDDLLEVLSRNGDGRYGFINTPEEAATEFAGQLAGALRVAASDVKVQIEFNPRRVTAYRQIGYAKHQLTKEQFRDNTVDAAEIGAAEAGNALYVVEVNPRGEGPLATLRVRYKVPGTTEYREQAWAVPYNGSAVPIEQASSAMKLALAASAFSEWLAGSPFAAEVSPDRLLGYLNGVPEIYGADARPKKLEWMIRQARSLAGK